MAERSGGVHGEDLQAVVGRVLRTVIPLGDRYAFMQFDTSGDEVLRAGYEAQLNWTTALVEDLKTEGVIRQDVPTRWAVAQIDQLIWVAWTAVSEWGLSPDDTATLAQSTLLDGLGNLSPPRQRT